MKFRARVTAHFDGICTTRNFHNLRFSSAKIYIFSIAFQENKGIFRNFLRGGGLILFPFPSRLGGRSNRVGPTKKIFENHRFQWPMGGGLAPRAPPEYVSAENLFQRNYYLAINLCKLFNILALKRRILCQIKYDVLLSSSIISLRLKGYRCELDMPPKWKVTRNYVFSPLNAI